MAGQLDHIQLTTTQLTQHVDDPAGLLDYVEEVMAEVWLRRGQGRTG